MENSGYEWLLTDVHNMNRPTGLNCLAWKSLAWKSCKKQHGVLAFNGICFPRIPCVCWPGLACATAYVDVPWWVGRRAGMPLENWPAPLQLTPPPPHTHTAHTDHSLDDPPSPPRTQVTCCCGCAPPPPRPHTHTYKRKVSFIGRKIVLRKFAGCG